MKNYSLKCICPVMPYCWAVVDNKGKIIREFRGPGSWDSAQDHLESLAGAAI
jgi:hypothetical protein